MANIRCMVVFQGFSGLPEDRFINTFHFSNGDTFNDHLIDVRAAVVEFYNTIAPGGDTAVGSFLSPVIQTAYELKQYDLSQPEPRVPVTSSHNLPSRNSTGMVNEVACVLSFHGTPPITPRRRGRIFLGPLGAGTSIFIFGTATQWPRFQPAVTTQIGASANRLAETAGLGWSIRSTRPAENFVPIVAGWVDDATDTQRRRGVDATARVVW